MGNHKKNGRPAACPPLVEDSDLGPPHYPPSLKFWQAGKCGLIYFITIFTSGGPSAALVKNGAHRWI
ncbi:MAG: hypothetical protein C3F02_02900 [Parcubacteria group bacterium]|nr:MAG: hypothetical protein C3F02_02900 [Parcubacteria group bacterium]